MNRINKTLFNYTYTMLHFTIISPKLLYIVKDIHKHTHTDIQTPKLLLVDTIL